MLMSNREAVQGLVLFTTVVVSVLAIMILG